MNHTLTIICASAPLPDIMFLFSSQGANLVRVAFAQRDEVMDEAVARLRKLIA